MNLLVDMVRGMPEMLEVSWVIFCETQEREPCGVCGMGRGSSERAVIHRCYSRAGLAANGIGSQT